MISCFLFLLAEGGKQDDGEGSSSSTIMACSSSIYLPTLFYSFMNWHF